MSVVKANIQLQDVYSKWWLYTLIFPMFRKVCFLPVIIFHFITSETFTFVLIQGIHIKSESLHEISPALPIKQYTLPAFMLMWFLIVHRFHTFWRSGLFNLKLFAVKFQLSRFRKSSTAFLVYISSGMNSISWTTHE